MEPRVGPNREKLMQLYRTCEDQSLINKFFQSFGPRSPDTVMATNSEQRNKAIMQNKKEYELMNAFHCDMPSGPYYWKNPDGVWGHLRLADKNCRCTYVPMRLCPFGGEYDPRMDNVTPFFENLEATAMMKDAEGMFVSPPAGTDPIEVDKLRVYFRTPELFYDRLEPGQGVMYHIKPAELRLSMYNAKANRRAFLAQLKKMLGLPPGPAKLPINERVTKTVEMQSLIQVALNEGVRRSGRRRNAPNWFAGPKSLPLKRQLFAQPTSEEKVQPQKKKKSANW